MKSQPEISQAMLNLENFKDGVNEKRIGGNEADPQTINTHDQLDAAIFALENHCQAGDSPYPMDDHCRTAFDTACNWLSDENPGQEEPVEWFKKLEGIKPEVGV